MDSTRDLVEAHSFSRRRLVTAFVTGAPGGREAEPARPARTIVAGLALVVLLIAGVAVRSVLAGSTDGDWKSSPSGSPASPAASHPTRTAQMLPTTPASPAALVSWGRSTR
jgi:hypothetical protein